MSAMTQLIGLVAIFLALVLAFALRRIVFARMAMRNIARRKRYVAIVVAGLMIATAMISGSLVMADTLDYVIKKDVFVTQGDADIVVTVEDAGGELLFFNESVAYDLVTAVQANSLEYVDAAAPRIREHFAVISEDGAYSSPAATLFAYDPDATIGSLYAADGSLIEPSMISNGSVVINRDLAGDLRASEGDTVLLIRHAGPPIPLIVSAISADEGLAMWRYSSNLYVELDFAQDHIFESPGMINAIDISCEGGMETGYLVSEEAVEELREVLSPDYEYAFDEMKRSGIETANTVSDMISQIFIIMSSFAIIAGVALIVNIFVMLAEERKPEMGISRAIGMQRGHLTQTFLYEGISYALVASIIGSFAGLLIASIMFALFGAVIAGGDLTFELHFQLESLVIAMCAGFLITALTVLVSSWRVSKLNIVRAIRDIPEPLLTKSERKYFAAGVAVVALGTAFTLLGASEHQSAGTTAGISMMLFGSAMVAVRFTNARLPFTVSGLLVIFWVLDPIDLEQALFGDMTGNIEMFIVSGVLLVTAGVIVVMFNNDLLLKALISVFGRRKSLLPVFKVAVSYPMNKKFRTGLTLFIFALVMFTVIILAMIASFQRESVDTLTEQFSGGYDIIAFSMLDLNDTALQTGIDNANSALGGQIVDSVSSAVTAPITLIPAGSEDSYRYSLIGLDEDLIESGRFSLSQRAADFESDAEAWMAVASDPNLVIIDGSVVRTAYGATFGTMLLDLGQSLTIVLQDGSVHNVTIAGIMDQLFLQGVFMSKTRVSEIAPTVDTNLFYFGTSLRDDITDAQVADELERAFLEYGLRTFVVRDTIEEFMSTVSSTMQLMEIFLGLGLVVGIAGLGIITIRNIAERRQEIGVMRAIGYEQRMILEAFVLETTFVSLLGITIGVLLGLALSYRLFEFGGFKDTSVFVVPWGEVLLVTFVAFAITLISTLPPSRRASRLAPAEALRRID